MLCTFLATWGCPARVLVATILSALINYVIATSELLRCAVTSEGDFSSVVVVSRSSRDVQLTRLRPHYDILYRHKQALNSTTQRRGWRNPLDTRLLCSNSLALPSIRNQIFGLRAVVYSGLNTDLNDSGFRLIVQTRLSCIITRNIQTCLEPHLWFQRRTQTF